MYMKYMKCQTGNTYIKSEYIKVNCEYIEVNQSIFYKSEYVNQNINIKILIYRSKSEYIEVNQSIYI